MLKKKMLITCLLVLLSFTLFSCEKENNRLNVALNNNEDSQVSQTVNTVEKDSTDPEPVPVSEASSYGTLNSITYRVLSSRVLDTTEHEVSDPSQKACLVSMVIENNSSDIFINSALMGFTIYDENGQEAYGIELSEKVSKASIDSLCAPDKIIYGEFVILVNKETEEITLSIQPDFMSDDHVDLVFNADGVMDDVLYQSSLDGPNYDLTFTDGLASYQVNEATISQDDDYTLLTLDMTVINNTSEEYTSYEIPFRLIDAKGMISRLHHSVTNDTFAYIPANGEKTSQVTYVLKNPEMKDFDLYFYPLGKKDYLDYLHVRVN